MTEPRWFSQPYPPEGASAAEGIRKQLGRPALDLLTILVREAAQNSWDARTTPRSEPVDFRLDIDTINIARAAAWRALLLDGAPRDPETFPLRATLRGGSIPVLSVSDRGTRGLGGPTRADDAIGSDRDFVSFVRNIGEPRDVELGGGTYGFGKGIFYLLSRAGTILVHSRCRTPDGTAQTRLIGCALWQSHVTAGRRYTGRHWWGDTSGEVVEPLIGDRAEAVAEQLGLKPFGTDETGTTVVVVEPELEGMTTDEAADYLAETISWHLWPKMVTMDGRPPSMRFTVACEGTEHPVPDPRQLRPLNMFVKAYENMRGPDGKNLNCLSPRKQLGRLGLTTSIMPPLESTAASRMLDIEQVVHHVCLMRPAELVVTYRAGQKPASTNLGYAGVFRADEAMDEVYAKAEPPTHDAWNPQSLEKPESTYVRTTFTRIDEELNKLAIMGGRVRAGAGHVALGAASSMFSGLMGGAWGIGGATSYSKPGDTSGPVDRHSAQRSKHRSAPKGRADDPAMSPPTGSSGNRTGRGPVRQRPRVEYVGDPYYEDLDDNTTVLVQEFRLPIPGPQRVRVDLAVSLPGMHRETDPPAGAREPELVGFRSTSGESRNAEARTFDGGDQVWRALVRPAPDTMTEIGITTTAVTP